MLCGSYISLFEIAFRNLQLYDSKACPLLQEKKLARRGQVKYLAS